MSRQKLIDHYEKGFLKKDIPAFNIGDTVEVHVRIVEEDKKRTQVFEGVVMKKKGTGLRSAFTVRKVSYGEGVERTFPLHSPNVEKVVVVKKGKVRRAKLYYLRKRVGKATKVEGEDLYGEASAQRDASVRKEGDKEGS